MRFWKSKKGRELFDLIVFAGIVLFLVKVVFLLNYVPTDSMEPTIHVGDITISFQGAYLFEEPKAGDIIVFRSYTEELFVKRIIGVPGDEITFSEGNVLINGAVIEEDYLPEGTETIIFGRSSFTVPEGRYFVMGDNRMNSGDSRFWKEPYVAKEDIKGKMLLVIPASKLIDGNNNVDP